MLEETMRPRLYRVWESEDGKTKPEGEEAQVKSLTPTDISNLKSTGGYVIEEIVEEKEVKPGFVQATFIEKSQTRHDKDEDE
jgi:hypothetical protein